jgi:UDP-N-acetylglucosamine 2-epimerase (non-hydrolysing)
MKKVVHVVGARPNFMKAAPVIRALGRLPLSQSLIHTGQHYDAQMSGVFFRQLGLPEPDINLGVGSDSHARQTGRAMQELEPVLAGMKPDLVLVYGDVNSTLAASLVCAKLLVPLGHVEAGLRSFDRTMPEEVNRLVTDRLSDLLFTPSADADKNLLAEGVERTRIVLVGNVMIDSLVRLLPETEARSIWHDYALVTLHRPSNVDDPEILGGLAQALTEMSHRIPVIFPVHPRTRVRLEVMDGVCRAENVRLMEPAGYVEFLELQSHARFVVTDSGGIQEETTYLGVPCITMRENTERPITVEIGSNVLVGHDLDRLHFEVDRILSGSARPGSVPPLWDGHAAERIALAVGQWLGLDAGREPGIANRGQRAVRRKLRPGRPAERARSEVS